ncbi:DUF2341 domain-containing protein [Ketobacter sp.]|uniref:DUF2341 domain-containing protein n=1 Tax=Ketobacter sp. TaxID=2083498 RepID=UPI000F20BFC4|nr:DUF2341 domain-containing protein [Ketobacter sp.]RLU01144.1 MAG: DUF2341 domain-containing protein [Ketobacter sp.]
MRSVVLMFLLFMLPGMASAWWNEEWPYRVGFTVDSATLSDTGVGSEVEAAALPGDGVPVLIRLHSANFGDFFLVKEDLSDLRFVAQDDKTPLKFHVESFDLLNQLAFIWVKMPVPQGAAATPQKIWMYYGNTQAVAGQDAAGTYGVNKVGVYHFNPLNPAPVDMSAYQNSAVTGDALVVPASLIAGGLSLSGSGALTIGQSATLAIDSAQGHSWSLWIKPTGDLAAGKRAVIVSQSDGNNTLELALNGALPEVTVIRAGTVATLNSSLPVSADRWQHLSLVMSATSISLYLDGETAASQPLTAPFTLGGPLLLGAKADNSQGLVAELDELQIDRTALSQSLLRFAAKSQGVMSTLVAASKAEQLGNAAGTSYFMTIFQSTGDEGWVVIFLLMVMAVISWGVMFLKALFISRAKKDNEAFLQQYRQLDNRHFDSLDVVDDDSADVANESQVLSLFGKHDHFQSSPLYHIYHKALSEVRNRVARSREQRVALSADVNADANLYLAESAVNSIRSGLEAYVVREIQALNRNMVLLTIAVSGGPFLGLLGTVLGVMITFAAIAASGDVNIAAIAPGVAAALLTTVAGLVVAIPALFGYNWLATRIKDMVADMHMFTDELVTRLAEKYSE